MLRILSLFLIFLCGCTSKSDHEIKLLLDWLPNPNHIPLYVGKKLGIFEQHGIELTILKSNDNNSGLGHLAFGQIDLVVTYMPSFVKAEINGAKGIYVAKLIDTPLDGLLFYQDGTIKTPQDLNGKVFGYSYDGTNLKYLLKENEIQPKQVLHCSFDLVGMLLTKQVDAVYGAYHTIEGAQLKKHGFPLGVFTMEELGFPSYSELIIVGNRNNANFAQALQESIDFCREDPEAAFEIYTTLFPEKSNETLGWEKSAWLNTVPLLPHHQTQDLKSIATLKDWFLSHS